MTKKEQELEWVIKQEKLFEVLKKRLIMEPISVAPNLDRKVRIEVNASDYTMGGVLSID